MRPFPSRLAAPEDRTAAPEGRTTGGDALCIINTYFAPLPRFVPLYFESCRRNPDVQFLFVSDQPRPSELPPNVRWMPTTLGELEARVTRAVGFPVRLSASLKVCDARPAFGLAFADELAGYTHWAYSDTDLVWGRVLPILRPYLPGADVLSFREGWLSGTFTVFRNTPVTARLFLRAPDLRDTLSTPSLCDFDESCGRWDRARSAAELLRSGLRTSFWDLLDAAHREGHIRWVHPDLLSEPNPRRSSFDFRWRDGQLVDARTGKERLAYHLLTAKRAPFFYIPRRWGARPAELRITEAGIRAAGAAWGFHALRLAHGIPRYAVELWGRVRRRLARSVRQLGAVRADPIESGAGRQAIAPPRALRPAPHRTARSH